ncbi:hypothetical protein CLV68_0618 [Actinokineospora cianjurensis]|uniref:Uncharacterized protein n=2 Tax=Actinokineospora cianjurensis TaxID=585224 RepID=A0A421B6P7_9PSEU|nr:hypothetical protein CLV68_0618 [Actinokineospora cianjurensis]
MGMDIDDELRRLFADERLDVPVRPGATEAVVTGAGRRRKRRHVVAAAGGALTVAALVAGGVVLSGMTNTSSAPPGQQVVPTMSATLKVTATPSTVAVLPDRTGSNSAGNTARTTAPSPSTGKLTTSVSKPPAVPELRPAGFGKIRIGMSIAEAEATGDLVLQDNGLPECASYTFKGYPDGSVGISPTDGVTAIFPPTGARTPEGIGHGSTQAEFRTAYPAATTDQHGYRIVRLDQGKVYSFGFGSGSKIDEVVLYTDKQMCFG